MKPKLFLFALLTWLGIGSLTPCFAAMLYVESFPSGGPKSGWYGTGDGGSTAGGTSEVNDHLEFFTNSYAFSSLVASPSASGGAFVGNYLAAGISGIRFDLQIAQGSALTALSLDLVAFNPAEHWSFALSLPALNTLSTYTVPLPANGAGWGHVEGTQSFSSMLTHVDQVAIVFQNSSNAPGGASPGNISGFIDNAATVPEPGSTIFLVFGVGLMSASPWLRKVWLTGQTRDQLIPGKVAAAP